MNKKVIILIALTAVALLLPELVFAAGTGGTTGNNANQVFDANSMQDVIKGFFEIALVKGIIMTATIGGGLYLVLAGFGFIGKDTQTDLKKIVLGGILTGIGLSYNALKDKISAQFV